MRSTIFSFFVLFSQVSGTRNVEEGQNRELAKFSFVADGVGAAHVVGEDNAEAKAHVKGKVLVESPNAGAGDPPALKCWFCLETFMLRSKEQNSWETLWHPYIWLYVLHLVGAGVAILCSVYLPKVLMAFMIGSGLVFVISMVGWDAQLNKEGKIEWGMPIWDQPAYTWDHACYVKIPGSCQMLGPQGWAPAVHNNNQWTFTGITQGQCDEEADGYKDISCSEDDRPEITWVPKCDGAPACLPKREDAYMNFDWKMVFIKWLIVSVMACVPVVATRAFDLDPKYTNYVGWFIHVVLGANVLWTLAYPINGWVRMVNGGIAASLTISLSIHMAALYKYGKPLMESKNGFPYSRGTRLEWLFCYTFWNAMFVADFSMPTTFQDILFWAMMISLRRFDPEDFRIEYYFAYARPVELGTYIAVGTWAGLFKFFQDGALLEGKPGKGLPQLPVNSHSFFVFLVILNFAYSLISILQAIQFFVYGPPEERDHKRLTMISMASLPKLPSWKRTSFAAGGEGVSFEGLPSDHADAAQASGPGPDHADAAHGHGHGHGHGHRHK